MPRITLIKLLKYREWTENLGSDREWKIQLVQSRIYHVLQSLFSKSGGFVIPLRYDYFIALSNGVSREIHEKILVDIESVAPYGVRIVSLSHKYPFTAQLYATRVIEHSTNKLVYIDGVEDENVVIHIDFNNISELTYSSSVFETYARITTIYSEITSYAARLGGITGYLGGDNMIVVLHMEALKEFLEILPSYLKAGVGVSKSPREALSLAAEALTRIRRERSLRYLVLSDNGVIHI